VQPSALATSILPVPAAQSRNELARGRALLEATSDGVLVTGADGRIAVANQSFCRLFQIDEPPADLVGVEMLILCERLQTAFIDAASFLSRVAHLISTRQAIARECWPLTDGRIVECDSVPVPVEGRLFEQLWVWRDVTDRVRLRSAEAQGRPLDPNLSFLDELTGLFNRRGFLIHARQQLDSAALVRRPMLLIFVDVDGLKQINDQLGHAVGDCALVDSGAVLRSTFRERDVVARLGGDEFVVLVTDASLVNPAGLLSRLENRLQALNDRPAREFQLAFSTGVASFDPGAPETLEALLSEADSRMYLEKRRRKNSSDAH
jgi:diguanylate cyclase (GGDEF)-like protein